MNINSFFLDKLSAGSQTPTSGPEKSSLSSYLFSDIMKVYELENGTEVKSQSDFENPPLNTMEGLSFTEGVIECNDLKLKTLSDFIKSFVDSSREAVNVSESKTDLQPIVISKKKFLLSSGGMENFLKGLVESININLSDDIKTTILSSKETKEELKELNLDVKTDVKEIPLLEKELDKKNTADLPLPASGTVLQSILDFLSQNKSLSLSFKSNLERVSINFLELPEDNIETKINLEKLASDFSREGKEIFSVGLESSNEIEKEGIISSSFTSLTENKPTDCSISSSEKTDLILGKDQKNVLNPELSLKTSGLNTQQNKNIYRTEIVEVSYKPDSLLNDFKVKVTSKQEKGLIDPMMLSGFTFDTPEVSDAQFRLSNNLTMQLNVDTSGEKNILGSTPFRQTEIPNLNYLFTQHTSPEIKSNNTESHKVSNQEIMSDKINESIITSDSKSTSETIESPLRYDLLKNEVGKEIVSDQAVAVKSNEKQEVVIDTKVLLNELNGKLVGVELKKTSVKNEVDAKSVPGDVIKESKVDVKDILSKPFTEIEVEENILKENLKNKIQSTDQKASDVEASDMNNTSKAQIKGKTGFEFIKTNGNNESVKIVKEEVTTKSVPGDVAKESDLDVKDVLKKPFIEVEENISKENLKHKLQSTDKKASDVEASDMNNTSKAQIKGKTGFEFIKTNGNNESIKIVKDEVTTKSVPGDVAKESDLDVKDVLKKPFIEVEENISKENLKHKIQSTDKKASDVEASDMNNTSKAQIKGKTGFEFIKTNGNNESVKIVKDEVTAKSISGDVAMESKVDVKDILSKPFTEIGVEENISKENLKHKIQSTDQKASDVEASDMNNTSKAQIKGKTGFEFIKTNGNNESVKIVKDEVTAKSISGDVATERMVDVKDAVNKIFAEIEYEKNKTIEKANNPLQETDSIVNNGELKDKKDLNNISNGKLSGVEFKKAVGKDGNEKNIKETENIKSVPGNLPPKSKVIVNKATNESSGGKDFANTNTGNNIKEISHTSDQITGTSEIENKKILFSELNAISGGSDVKKSAGKEDSAKAIKDDLSTKSASEKNVTEKMVKETENKSSEGKDFAKHKSEEGFKNTLQSTERISGNDSDKFKITPELKTSPEIPKTIKTHEIIPEFTKIIQSGAKQSMTFQLTPENLGKVKLIVELVENQISTRIEVENEQVKQFVQSNVEQLKQNLQSSGIQLSSVNISLTEPEQKFSKGFAPRKKSGERVNKVKVSDEKTTPAQKSLGYNTYEFLA